MKADKTQMQIVEWPDIRSRLKAINPHLSDMIDEVGPGKNHYLYQVKYPFGSQILKNGILHLPNNEGELIPYDSSDLPKNVCKDLGYAHGSNPVAIVIKNTAEMFARVGSRLIPIFNLITEGNIFGLWNILSTELEKLKIHRFHKTIHNTTVWELTAGSRFLFMLPKISRTILHNRLVYMLQIENGIPNNLLDHWALFKEIDNKVTDEDPWSLEILFLPQSWINSMSSKKWIKLYSYLLSTIWTNTEFWREKFIWDMLFAQIQENANIKPDPYITKTVEHLFAIATGAVPGFGPAINNEAGPIAKIQQVYRDIYKIEYDPIIMQPLAFNPSKDISRPVYYSLEFPTALELSPKTKAQSSKLADLVQINYIFNKFKKDIINNNFNLSDTQFYHLVTNVDYNFFHDDESSHPNIKKTKTLPIDDKNFLVSNEKNLSKFPENSPFLRGCVRISSKREK